ncbi:hypothetical protein K3725_12915 [Leisingera sp. S132]|uniref:hypothetical protein n=1 Tax=Leisingera sp. S132 TaxID=2867016 RepID=UPI0021A542F7|nr:hypothetical protein [Leisingera sp. S132]UWQ78218.1 hypothetical protein K3725_12915 [Leisingera sp. S132]
MRKKFPALAFFDPGARLATGHASRRPPAPRKTAPFPRLCGNLHPVGVHCILCLDLGVARLADLPSPIVTAMQCVFKVPRMRQEQQRKLMTTNENRVSKEGDGANEKSFYEPL